VREVGVAVGLAVALVAEEEIRPRTKYRPAVRVVGYRKQLLPDINQKVLPTTLL